MGRTEDSERQTAKIPFCGKKIKAYQPKPGQITALALIARKNKAPGVDDLVRIFRVLEALVVDPEQWTQMEDLMISGDADIPDFHQFMEDVMNYEWAETEEDA